MTTNLANHHSDLKGLESGIPPTWASEWGEDQFGPFCSIEIHEVVQRLRWIDRGTFWMGSPEDEKGRWTNEGPRHLVTIESGFWIFDTPCTQRLWTTVMGSNPSHFQEKDLTKTENHPVEMVSWNECQEFIEKLNKQLSGLTLSLPSEAQWEYACRAGVEKARYADDLDAIAWHQETSEVDSHPVGEKQPNASGLYDMLGNVYEWCMDNFTDDYSAGPHAAPSVEKVRRGGSWRSGARYVRAALRGGLDPTYQYYNVGCRLAEFREGVVS